MPGITGIIGAGSAEERSNALAQMGHSMRHDPSDTMGSLPIEELGLWIGWVCKEGSGVLPAWNEARDICIVFIGENFPEEADVARLKSKGRQFRSGDASYLVHLYEEKGLGFLRDINGWFSGVLIDLRQSKVVLFNDRYGFHRIYYH